ncbi:CYTH domain-containing protein [Salinicola sp. CPA57]|uniref:CYTH domain-containing protein n=1 Tax=Salinicola sp. CPA57 TaxID=1949080 RepID=UPI001300A5D0|nr:CYTH domain-containing protein [Salinicola sp. CPA57]
MSDEIELKLALAPEGPAHLIDHPLLQTMASRTVSLGNQYYDTAEGILQSRRVALRVRRQDDRRLQTLKSAAESQGGLSSRGEWEWSIDSAACNAAGLDLGGLRELDHPALSGLDLETLRPVFTTDFERRLWRYQIEGSDIEIALDQGTIHVGDASLPICELELELKHGLPEQLWALAQRLCEPSTSGAPPLPARPANHSKASRAGCLGSGWTAPIVIETASVDALIDAIDNWQDSQAPAWLATARDRCDRLVQQWNARRIAPHREHDERIEAAERILADLGRGVVPWRGQDWLALRHDAA